MSFDNTQFTAIPQLPELLKGTWGIPGLTYAHVCLHNASRAQSNRFRPVPGVPFYDVVGPKGTANLCLMYTGVPLPGAGSGASRPLVLADPEILKLSGINPNPDLLSEPEPAAAPAPTTPLPKTPAPTTVTK